jgi:hypothetical protein
MHCNDVGLLDRLLEKLRDRPQDEGITDSVKPIFAKSIRFGNLLVNRISLHMFRYRLVEGRVKERDALDTGNFLLASANDLQS